jgi:hypothetical protein
MMPVRQIVSIRCKNEKCDCHEQPTFLPFSSPVEMYEGQRRWPKEFLDVRVVCRECRHWYKYLGREFDIQMVLEADLPIYLGPAVWYVLIKCAEPDCGPPSKWYVADDTGLSLDDILRLVFASTPEITRENGHSLKRNGVQSTATNLRNVGKD